MNTDIHPLEVAVIRVLLNDSDALVTLTEALPDARYFADARLGAVYRAALDLARRQVLPNPATIARQLDWPLADVQALAVGYTRKEAEEVFYIAQDVAKAGQLRLLRQALREADELTQRPISDMAGLTTFIMQMVADTTEDMAGQRDPAVAEIGRLYDERQAEIARRGTLGLKTRLQWLNDKTGGLTPAMFWILSGMYKGRKTTVMRNLIIDACRAGGAVSVFALEGDRYSTFAGLLAMLATERLLAWNQETQAYLSDTFILRGMRSEVQNDAIADARRELDRFKLYIYDGQDGIGTPEKVALKLRRDTLLHGVSVFALDYLQLLGEGKLFDRLEKSTHALQRMVVEQEVCGIALAQLNESTIWQMRSEEGAKNPSPGVKGGGDPAAAADFLFRTIPSADDPGILTLDLKLARHAQPGQLNVSINRQSGHIIGPA